MEVKNKKLIKLKRIVNYLFSENALYLWNCRTENFKELKTMFTQKKAEKFSDNINLLQAAQAKEKFFVSNTTFSLLKTIYYMNLLEYLKLKKTKLEIIYKNFFDCLKIFVYDHFMIKIRNYNGTEKEYYKDENNAKREAKK